MWNSQRIFAEDAGFAAWACRSSMNDVADCAGHGFPGMADDDRHNQTCAPLNTARPQPEVAEVRKPHRWRQRLIVSAGLLAARFGLSLIVSFTAARPIGRCVMRWPGSTARSAPAAPYGWLSPVEFRDVQIRDAKGNLLLTAATIRSQRPLWQLVAHSSDLGTLTIAQPKLGLELRPDGSNAEDVLLPWLTRSSTGASPTLALQVADGHIDLHDVAADQRWRRVAGGRSAHDSAEFAGRGFGFGIDRQRRVANQYGFELLAAAGRRGIASFQVHISERPARHRLVREPTRPPSRPLSSRALSCKCIHSR